MNMMTQPREYPPQSEVLAMVAATGLPDSMAYSRVAIDLDLTWFEVNEIVSCGRVHEDTARFWRKIRRAANGSQ